MAITVAQMKTWIAGEAAPVEQAVHNFITWVEQKTNQIDGAKAILAKEGYTLHAPDGTVTAPTTPPAA